MHSPCDLTRRQFLGTAGLATIGGGSTPHAHAAEPGKALVAITLDLEMSRNFPTREDMHWDYEKGNLNAEAKAYTVEACRRVKAAGGVLHCFAVGQVFEQEDVAWLKGIVKDGHPVGNHTYDHVNVLATRPEDVQFRFQRAPWLIKGRTTAEVIRDNVRLATDAMRARLGCEPAGFRTPGGFADGLRTRPDVRAMLRERGFDWVSSLYPTHAVARPLEKPSTEFYDSIVQSQAAAQPFVYSDGLVEVPMSPISDIGAFRTGRWQLEWFLEAVRLGVEWAIDHRAVYDFLGHPSCLYVTDPTFRAIELICDRVRKAGDRAAIVGLDTIAQRARFA
jgi:peptidoglycan/xylan/chitin deacetylase (PgdA/CDA1 family)